MADLWKKPPINFIPNTPGRTLGQRNNNPGNLRWHDKDTYNGTIGWDNSNNQHNVFAREDYGWRAQLTNLYSHIKSYPKHSIRDWIEGTKDWQGYAEGSKKDYIEFIEKKTGKSANLPMSAFNPLELVNVMALWESNMQMTPDMRKRVLEMMEKER